MYRGCDVANLTVAGEGGGFRATAASRAPLGDGAAEAAGGGLGVAVIGVVAARR